MPDVERIDASALRRFCEAVLTQVDVPDAAARLVADCLVSANLHGVDTHGVVRLPTYVRRIAQGAIDPRAEPFVAVRHGAVAIVDAANALGPIGAAKGMELAIACARESGIGYVGVRNSNHFSYAAYYCELAVRAGMIGLCSSGGEPTVAPWGGIDAFYTNSPVALAAPTSSNALVVDLATSVTSRGNISLAKLLGQSIPEGWAVDETGRPTTDPAAALRGCVLPMGGAKGYALIVALEVLNGVLTGGAFAPDVGSQAAQDDRAARVPHFCLALDPAALIGQQRFVERMDRLVRATHAARASDPAQPVRLPGERRDEIAAERGRDGIPVPDELRTELRSMAERYAPTAKELL
jgi:LDH2 family malate/lactate/ureidoglycolate dehydrogenase